MRFQDPALGVALRITFGERWSSRGRVHSQIEGERRPPVDGQSKTDPRLRDPGHAELEVLRLRRDLDARLDEVPSIIQRPHRDARRALGSRERAVGKCNIDGHGDGRAPY